jgi:Pvc16 N-terminal domain
MISTLDISTVTDRVVDYLTAAVTNWAGWSNNGGSITPFNIEVSGRMPETARNLSGCQLTMYLFHVNAEPATRNTPLSGSVAVPNRAQALGLTLFYLLTAFSRDSTIQEQQALSIAVKALHERGTYIDPADGFTFTITLETEKPDEANRRWQSFTTAFRLSAVYRVSVVFLTPVARIPVPAQPPQRIGLSLAPMALPFAGAGALTSTASRIDFLPLHPQPGDTVVYDYSPAVVQPGGSFSAFGGGLDQPTAKRLYLTNPVTGTETEVTPWKAPAVQNTASRIVAKLPTTVGAIPANSPNPGVYQLRVGSAITSGDAKDYRSNAVPVLISPRIDPPPSPWNPAAGIFSFTGAGFVGNVELLLDTVTLHAVAAPPAQGQFQVAGGTINFQPPAGMPAGSYFVRLRVNSVEAPPVGKVTLP